MTIINVNGFYVKDKLHDLETYLDFSGRKN
jgi:hypothetical protein